MQADQTFKGFSTLTLLNFQSQTCAKCRGDSENNWVDPLSADADPRLGVALQRVRELELELAQTKLEHVEAECRNQVSFTYSFVSSRINKFGISPGPDASVECCQLRAAGKQRIVAAQDAVIHQGGCQKRWKHPASDEERVQGWTVQGCCLIIHIWCCCTPCRLVIALSVLKVIYQIMLFLNQRGPVGVSVMFPSILNSLVTD
jgi:hypothetical protein